MELPTQRGQLQLLSPPLAIRVVLVFRRRRFLRRLERIWRPRRRLCLLVEGLVDGRRGNGDILELTRLMDAMGGLVDLMLIGNMLLILLVLTKLIRLPAISLLLSLGGRLLLLGTLHL